MKRRLFFSLLLSSSLGTTLALAQSELTATASSESASVSVPGVEPDSNRPPAVPASDNSKCLPSLASDSWAVREEGAASCPAPVASSTARATGTVAGAPGTSAKTAGVSAVRPTVPQTAKSEFEFYAEAAANRPMPVYGRQLFEDVPTTFAPVDNVPVPADYVVGPGDQLLIRVWGKIDFASSVSVDRNGQIFVPKVGALSVAGLRYEQLEGYLESALGNLYKGFSLNVTMGQLRSIRIYVLGSARKPGAYTVSSLSTLVNALFASGGPSATGSMRHIELRRGNRLLAEFDVYDLLRQGDKSHDEQLLPGDVIYIPPVGAQVAIQGSVNDPGIYELRGETTIASALKEAGGLTGLAGSDRVRLERIENHVRRRVDEFPLDASGLLRTLGDGDMLEVFPISPRFENAVTLRGNVARPGRFSWHEGMRVADLIPSRDVLVTRQYWNQQNRLATNGHVDMMTDLTENSAEINWDYAAVERLDAQDLSTRVLPFNLGRAIEAPSSSDNLLLKAGDIVTIFARKDLPLPEGKHAAFVRVGGEVNTPGVYPIEPGETLRNIVERAGGLTRQAYLYASQLTRASTRQIQEEQLRVSVDQMKRDLVSRYAAAPSLSTTNAAEQQAQLAAQQAAITQLATVRPTGRVVLELRPEAKAVADIPDFQLEDGDTFYVPPQLSTVQVSGAVYNENAFRYEPSKRLAAYLKAAGGPTRQADAKRVYLIRADGTVVSSQHRHSELWANDFARLPVLPGDAIVVPTKLKSPNNFMQQLPFYTQLISQTAMTGAIASSW